MAVQVYSLYCLLMLRLMLFVVDFVNKNGGRFSVVTYKYANEGINEID